jgi:hypothetical protein
MSSQLARDAVTETITRNDSIPYNLLDTPFHLSDRSDPLIELKSINDSVCRLNKYINT